MITISLVEDRDDVRRSLVKRINSMEGVQCISDYRSPETAVQQIPGENPDIILMDIGLPGMSGIDCMLQILAKTNHPKFLMFTVHDNDDNLFAALEAGASGYVLKHEGANGAVRAIRHLVNGGGPMSPAVERKVIHSFRKNKPNWEGILTRQQIKVMDLLTKGKLNKEIGEVLKIKEGTVKQHVHAAYQKIGVNNRTEAVRKYLGL